MKKLILASVLIMIAISVSAQKNFNGTWKLNREKSNPPTDQLFLSEITILMKKDSLITNRTYIDPGYQEYPFSENLTLDSKEVKIIVYDMPRTAKASKGEKGTILFESKTIFNGGYGEESLITKETWRTDGKSLTMDTSNSMLGQEFIGVFIYDKVK